MKVSPAMTCPADGTVSTSAPLRQTLASIPTVRTRQAGSGRILPTHQRDTGRLTEACRARPNRRDHLAERVVV